MSLCNNINWRLFSSSSCCSSSSLSFCPPMLLLLTRRKHCCSHKFATAAVCSPPTSKYSTAHFAAASSPAKVTAAAEREQRDQQQQQQQQQHIVRSSFPPVPVQNVPLTDTLLDAVWRHTLEQPGQPAFISAECPADQLTFAEFLLQCYSVANFLDSIGFGHGDVATVATPNCWHFLAAFIGAAMQGGCISGANCLLTETELAYQINESRSKAIFCADFMLDKVQAIEGQCQPHLKQLVLIPYQFPAKPLSNLAPNVLNWADIVHSRPAFNNRRPLSPPIDVDRDLAYLPFSSGTTGPPKGVMLSHRNVATMACILNTHFDEQVCQRMDPNWDWKKEKAMLLLPLYHIYGFVVGLKALLNGSTAITYKKFDLELFCKTIQDYKFKFASLVPPILVRLAKSPSVTSRFDLSSLRFIMTGAAPAGDDLLADVKRQIPSVEQIAQGYGMTEQSMCSHLPVFGMDNPRAAGRLNPNFEMKIIDTENGTPLKAGQLGQICTRSPTTMLGYLNRAEATAETIDSEGWLKTGDIGYYDDQGWTYVVDRLKELIKVNGLQVAPAELEDLLLSHPGVRDCAVIGIPDENCGEVPKAFIVKADDANELSEEEVKQFVKEKVASFKQLKFVKFIDEIPKSPSGKILRRLLRGK